MSQTNKLFELSELAKEQGRYYTKRRELYDELTAVGKPMLGIVGPRGVGKTVLLKQLAAETENSVYISLDTLAGDLFETVKQLVEKHKIRFFLLDEIHFQKNFERSLKQIFDFLSVKVVFTSSVALSILESSYDLSRRVKIIPLYPFSFAQFLQFKKEINLPPLTIQMIADNKFEKHLPYEYLFKEYMQGGLFPFALEESNILPLLENILKTIIQKDIPSVANIRTDEIKLIEKTISFIGKSPADGVNYSSVSQNIGITKYKAEEYLQLLERAFVLQLVWPKGTNVMREPKVLLSLPYRLLFYDFQQAAGSLREDFFVQSMAMSRQSIHYLKSTRGAKTPDYWVRENERDWVIEIGGKGKGRSQFKGFSAENKLTLVQADKYRHDQRPLFLVGFLQTAYQRVS